MPDELANGRNERNEDDDDDHQGEVVLDDRDIAEEITRQRQAADPGQTAQCAEHQEQAIAHGTDASHERCESTDDGQKARKDDGLAAVLGEEEVSLLQMFVLDEALTGAVE